MRKRKTFMTECMNSASGNKGSRYLFISGKARKGVHDIGFEPRFKLFSVGVFHNGGVDEDLGAEGYLDALFIAGAVDDAFENVGNAADIAFELLGIDVLPLPRMIIFFFLPVIRSLSSSSSLP